MGAAGGFAGLLGWLGLPPEAALLARLLGGFAIGLLQVTMMVGAMRSFPPPQRPLPLVLFALARARSLALLALWRRNSIDLSRLRELRTTGAGTQARLDDLTAADQPTRATVLEAKANLDLQRQTLQQVDADALVAGDAGRGGASLASARIALEDTEVWAPIAGVVANRCMRVGEHVAVRTRMPSIVPLEGLWIEANFCETQMERMAAVELPLRPGLDPTRGSGR
ncbi:hypothetical protein JMJ56_12975 [Belnapia sp. T18]|uniref:Uncharacterized protein n=1 Tax=Belnapia arida TaxID=2804533 RepID=A0ABS1U4R6_9PROT|nr:hypothetical protein [Belnapia arida]MBL6078924.1 hypothetical protein [Belnapia arida]